MSKKNFSGNNIKDDSLKSSHPDKGRAEALLFLSG